MDTAPERSVAAGEIVGTHGVGGLLRFRPYSTPAAALRPGQTVTLTPPAGPARAMVVHAASPHGRVILLGFEGIDRVETAAPLVRAVLSVSEADLPAPAPGEFYAYQLIGLEVVTVGGERLGTIASSFPTGSNEVLVVRDGAHEHLIPCIADVVRQLDIAGGRIVIDPIEGLLG